MSREVSSYRFGDFTLERRLQRLLRNDEIVSLKPKAYDLLCVLLADRERVVGKEELLDWLWPRQDVSEANLAQTIYELRRALGETARTPNWIETIPRRGYRFKGEVEEISPQDRAGTPPRSIAVLPFRALTDNPTCRDLGLGIADAVILSLGSTERIVVRSLSSVLRYLETEADAVAIGRLLEVHVVLEGSVQQFGDRIGVNTRLIDVPGGATRWADRQQVDAADWFSVQRDIALQVSAAVAVSLHSHERERMAREAPRNAEVHARYLKARYCWSRWSPEASRQAVEYLNSAIEIDPGHAPSHAWLSAAWSTLGIFGVESPSDAAAHAREYASRAIELDPQLSAGFEMLGAVELFFDWNLRTAAQSLDRAIELNHDSANARHLRALALAFSHRNEAAFAEMLRAVQSDPSSLIANTDAGLILYWARRFDEARQWLESTLRQEPGFAHARFALAYTLIALGREADAVAEMRRAAATSGRAAAGELAFALARAGRCDEARETVVQLKNEIGSRPADPLQVALAYLGLAEHDETLMWLRRAFDYRSRDLVLIGVDPIYDPLRAEPRFDELLQAVGLN